MKIKVSESFAEKIMPHCSQVIFQNILWNVVNMVRTYDVQFGEYMYELELSPAEEGEND